MKAAGLLLLVALSSCGFREGQARAARILAGDAVDAIVYRQDPRSGLCFAVYSDGFGHGMLLVPAEACIAVVAK